MNKPEKDGDEFHSYFSDNGRSIVCNVSAGESQLFLS